MKKFISNLLVIVCMLVFVWIFVSYIDVVWDNSMPNPTHASWNFFTLLF